MNSFWDTDLDVLEASFLPYGVKITDLPTTLDNRVPARDSVLLDRVINIKGLIKGIKEDGSKVEGCRLGAD